MIKLENFDDLLNSIKKNIAFICLLYINEYQRTMKYILSELFLDNILFKKVYIFDYTNGFSEIINIKGDYITICNDYEKDVLRFFSDIKIKNIKSAVIILKNFSSIFNTNIANDVIEKFLEMKIYLENNLCSFVLIEENRKKIEPIESYLDVIEFPLVSSDNIAFYLYDYLNELQKNRNISINLNKGEIHKLSYLQIGLTSSQIENNISKIDTVINGEINFRSLQKYFIECSKDNPYFKITSIESCPYLFGLDKLKLYFKDNIDYQYCNIYETINTGDESFRLMIFLGNSGVGKDRAVEYYSYYYQLPLIKVNFEDLLNTHVGESEENLRMVFKYLLKNNFPAIIYIAEIEKIFGLDALQGINTSDVTRHLYSMFIKTINVDSVKIRKIPQIWILSSNSFNLKFELFNRSGEIFFFDTFKKEESFSFVSMLAKKYNLNIDSQILMDISKDNFSGRDFQNIDKRLGAVYSRNKSIDENTFLKILTDFNPSFSVYKDQLKELNNFVQNNKVNFVSSYAENQYRGHSNQTSITNNYLL